MPNSGGVMYETPPQPRYVARANSSGFSTPRMDDGHASRASDGEGGVDPNVYVPLSLGIHFRYPTLAFWPRHPPAPSLSTVKTDHLPHHQLPHCGHRPWHLLPGWIRPRPLPNS